MKLYFLSQSESGRWPGLDSGSGKIYFFHDQKRTGSS